MAIYSGTTVTCGSQYAHAYVDYNLCWFVPLTYIWFVRSLLNGKVRAGKLRCFF